MRKVVLAISLAALLPASPAFASDRLQCALALIPADSRRELAARYERDRGDAELVTAIPQEVFERIGFQCADLEADDAAGRASRLGQAIMAWQLMQVSQDMLVRRHGLTTAALDQAWAGLSAEDRGRFADFERADGNAQLVFGLAVRLRPDVEQAAGPAAQNSADADQAYLVLIEDVAVYASSRALIERLEGSY